MNGDVRIKRSFTRDWIWVYLAGAKYKRSLRKTESCLGRSASRREIILFIDEIHRWWRGHGGDARWMPNVLKPALAKGDLSVQWRHHLNEYQKFLKRTRRWNAGSRR